MFIRIVKMSFHPKYIDQFQKIFDEKKIAIKAYKGCNLLELYQDNKNPEIFFTYSYWEQEKDLESYRNSLLFKNIWAKTKLLFNDRPLAWSVDKKVSLK